MPLLWHSFHGLTKFVKLRELQSTVLKKVLAACPLSLNLVSANFTLTFHAEVDSFLALMRLHPQISAVIGLLVYIC